MEEAKSVKTPGEDVPTWKLEAEEEFLDNVQATKFRMVVARANYLATDRTDIQYATKECCMGNGKPPTQTLHHDEEVSKIPRW